MPRSSDSGSFGGRHDAASLFETYADQVGMWAARLGGPMLDVEDTVQEVFIIVHRRSARFRGDSSLKSWLYGITANVVRQQRRKARRRRWFGRGSEDAATELAVAAQPTPVEELERDRRTRAVYRVLDAMRETNRALLILFELEGLAGEEIAELLAMRVATVWVKLHRAREEFSRLARQLIPAEVEEAELRFAARSHPKKGVR
ncbi:MAG TPA: sigma-70 family RNA polymerase sigma factor [Polyangia bacterium]|nr:sigma-70 family RNA polymerase sigma factor [Polyangia bacterium]